jgi:ribonuclease R
VIFDQVMISDQAILQKIGRQPKQSAGFKQLVRELRVRGEERRQLAERLHSLVKRGQLVEVGSDRYAMPRAAAQKNLVAGRLSMHRDGYGFVTPDSAELRQRLSGDIFINPQAIGNAMHGDKVLVEMGPVRSDGRAEGRVVRVGERAHTTVVGIFHYGDRYNYVAPMDEKITQEIVIPVGMEWPAAEEPNAEGPEKEEGEAARGRVARVHTSQADGQDGKSETNQSSGRVPRDQTSQHRVIGEEARRREVPRPASGGTEEWEDLDGVVVDVEITDWPTASQNPRGRVVEILGYEDDFGVDVEIIIRKFHLPHRFSPEVLEEAQSIAAVISSPELQKRRDFRHRSIVTIDGETARDFDDAVMVRRLENGNYELQVHIADVAHYVREGSELDNEASMRGTSVYFPDRAVPMLPVELSTDICSLRPEVDRLVLSCVMEIDHQGEVLGYELSEGVIRSDERMTYTDVNAVLEGDQHLRQRYALLLESFELMRELEGVLNRKRVRRGSIDFDLPEPVIEFDEAGLMRGITRSDRNVAHRLIEEFMLAANECVASYLEQREIASIYRIHEPPDPKKVYEFETLAAAFGYSLGVGALPVQRVQVRGDRRANYGRGQRPGEVEIPQDVHITPRMYQKLTQKIAGKPEERILSFLMLRSLKQARYSEENVGHFALAAPTYTHFTSPIRRYPDLMVHRILKEVLRDSAEHHEDGTPVGRGVPVSRPYGQEEGARGDGHSGNRKQARGKKEREAWRGLSGPIPEPVLHDIAEQSSQTERRADDAERELMEWKKIKFMHDRIGEEFEALIVSVTKFGFFVELTELFIEGLVPLSTLSSDRFTYRENTKQIIGERTGKAYSLGDKVRVWVDRIDRVQKKVQFAVVEEEPAKRSPRTKKQRKRG